MPQKNKGLKIILIPILVVLLGLTIAGPILASSFIETLSTSSAFQYLTGGDAAGASYSNPSNIVLGKGDKMLNLACNVSEADWGDCGIASVLMVAKFFNPQTYGDRNDTSGMVISDLATMLNDMTADKAGTWDKVTPWDFGKAQRSIDQGYPVLIYTGRYLSKGNSFGHIMVIVGYKNNGNLIINSSTKGGCHTEVHSLSEIESWGPYHSGDSQIKQMIFSSNVK